MPPQWYLLLRDERSGRPPRDDSEQVFPAPSYAPRVTLDQFLERHAHLLLDGAWRVDVSGDVEQLRARVARAPEACEPGAAATQDRLQKDY